MDALTLQVIREKYKDGDLKWMLHSAQIQIYNAIKSHDGRLFVINCARRLGKSFLCVLYAFEMAFKKPGLQIKYLAPTQKQVRKIILPLVRQILRDCPRDLYPKFDKVDGVFYFNNGSEIHMAGADKNYAENLRGQKMDIGIVDEAGQINNLDYVVKDILQPQTLTVDNSLIILASTPPPQAMAHDFTRFVEQAKAGGYYIRMTIYQNPMITPIKIMEYAKELGGFDSTAFKRELMAEFVMDENYAIIPEFNDKKEAQLVKEMPRPPYYDAYVSMDIGFVDYTGVIFCYFDFINSAIVIEDEILINKMNTIELKTAISNKERHLWGNKEPYLRISDIDLIVIHDLASIHNMQFIPTEKDDLHAAVNQVRIMVQQNRIIIHPRCTNLIAQLKFGTWDKQRKKFERTSTFGHFDMVSSLVYLCRNVRYEKNPYPALDPSVKHSTHFIPNADYERTQNAKVIRGMFTRES